MTRARSRTLQPRKRESKLGETPLHETRASPDLGAIEEAPAFDMVSPQDMLGPEMAPAVEEQLSDEQSEQRALAPDIHFQVNEAQITGKQGFQVRGTALQLDKGVVMDLVPAQLTGEIAQGKQVAKGSGAQLYISMPEGGGIVQETLHNVYLDEQQTVFAISIEAIQMHLTKMDLNLGPLLVTQNVGRGKTELAFGHTTVTALDSDAKATSGGLVQLREGSLLLERMDIQRADTKLELQTLTLTGKDLRYERGTLTEKTGTGELGLGTIGELFGHFAAQAEKTPAQPSRRRNSTSALPTPELSTPETPTEAAPKAVSLISGAEYQAVGGLLTPYDIKPEADPKTGTAQFLLNGTLVTTGEYGVDFGTVSAKIKAVSYTVNDTQQMTAALGDFDLTIENEALENYAVSFRDAQLAAGVFSVGEIKVVETSSNAGFTVDNGDAEGLAQLLCFNIPPMPKGSVFTMPGASGPTMQADFSRLTESTYAINDLAGIFSASLDLENKTFSLSAKKEEDLAENGFFSKQGIPLGEFVILPGLTFSISVEPSAAMSGNFALSGNLPVKGADLNLKGGVGFTIGVGVQLNADLNVGASSLLALYVGLFGKAEAELTSGLELEISGARDAATGKLKLSEMDLSGNIEAELKGSIGAHGGAKILAWKAELFEYTFKEWVLAKLALSAAISKDMTQGFRKGWKLEKSSFTAEAFGKMLTQEALNIQATQATLANAVTLTGDFETLKKNVAEVVSTYHTLQEQISATGGKGLIVDMTVIGKQVTALLALGEELKTKTAESTAAEAELQNTFSALIAQLPKEKRAHGESLKKHGLRIGYVSHIQGLMNQDPAMGYDDAEKTARGALDRKIMLQELSKASIYQRLLDHENERLAFAKKKGDKKREAEHTGRIATLKKTADAYSNDSERNEALLALGFGQLGAKLKEEVGKKVTTRQKEVYSMAAFQRSTQYEPFKKTGETDQRAVVSARLAYEHEAYNEEAQIRCENRMHEILERTSKLKKIKEEGIAIQEAMEPLRSLQGSYSESEVAAVFQQLQGLLRIGQNLDETVKSFDYFTEAQASREQQRLYLNQALGHTNTSVSGGQTP